MPELFQVMKEFFLALLFAKSMLLTPHPVSFEGSHELAVTAPLEAISSGAHIEIRVTSMIAPSKGEAIPELRRRIIEMFPAQSIEAHLFDRSGKELVMTYGGFSAFSDKDVWLTLDNESGTPTDTEFVKVIIRSKRPLKDVSIYWNNYKK